MGEIINFCPEFRTIKLNQDSKIIFGGSQVDIRKVKTAKDYRNLKDEIILSLEYGLESLSMAYDMNIDIKFDGGTIFITFPKKAQLDDYVQLDLSKDNSEFARNLKSLSRNKGDSIDFYHMNTDGSNYMSYDLDETLNVKRAMSLVTGFQKSFLEPPGLNYQSYRSICNENVVIETYIRRFE